MTQLSKQQVIDTLALVGRRAAIDSSAWHPVDLAHSMGDAIQLAAETMVTLNDASPSHLSWDGVMVK